MSRAPMLGITVMPEWIQAEGAETVLANLQRAGATAVATSPYVMAPSDAPDAGREPPIDAGSGKVRLLDRPLWGKRELRCTTAPSFAPDLGFYEGCAYRPSAPTELTRAEGPKVGAFLERAKAAGLEVQLQVQAAIPPGYRVQFGGAREEDMPRLPDGSLHEGRVDKNASLASPEIVAYIQALLRDLARAYPMVDAIRVDWPEYPPYSLLSWFFDFSEHALRAARAKGYDVETMRRDCLEMMRHPDRLIEQGFKVPTGFTSLQAFKASLVVDLLEACREALPRQIRLVAHAFPAPWCSLTGMDMARAGRIADELAVKLYTMHWPMMLDDYRRRIEEAGTAMTSAQVVRRLQAIFDTGDEPLERIRYPESDERHPVSAAAQARKIEVARRTVASIVPAAHSYGPLDDVLARAEIAFTAGGRRLWINRYGYLSDAKLDGLGRMSRAVPTSPA